MPRGKYVNHKGRSRHFTSPEELQQESDDESEQTSSGSEDDENADSDGDKSKLATGSSTSAKSKQVRKSARSAQKHRNAAAASSSDNDSDEESDDSELEARGAKKGVASLIEIENPNRVTKKATQKVSQLHLDDSAASSSSSKPELSRREREQIEKQKARQRYEKLHAAGKTTEAKADLARLALIRHQREEAAAKREAEKKAAAEAKKPATK